MPRAVVDSEAAFNVSVDEGARSVVVLVDHGDRAVLPVKGQQLGIRDRFPLRESYEDGRPRGCSNPYDSLTVTRRGPYNSNPITVQTIKLSRYSSS
jgi:hypothetical protein